MIGPKATLDPAKVLWARISYGDKRTNTRLAKALRMDSIYFDERIDTTVIRETAKTKVTLGRGVQEEAETFVQRTAKEEHCPVIMHGPEGEVYIETHKLEVGTGRALADKLVKSLEKQQSKDTVKVIGSDSCSKNTGPDNGAQACVEQKLKRPPSEGSVFEAHQRNCLAQVLQDN